MVFPIFVHVEGVVKPDAPELEGLGFMEDPTKQLEDLIVPPSQSESRCIDKIAFSSFNPVPGYRRYYIQYIAFS